MDNHEMEDSDITEETTQLHGLVSKIQEQLNACSIAMALVLTQQAHTQCEYWCIKQPEIDHSEQYTEMQKYCEQIQKYRNLLSDEYNEFIWPCTSPDNVYQNIQVADRCVESLSVCESFSHIKSTLRRFCEEEIPYTSMETEMNGLIIPMAWVHQMEHYFTDLCGDAVDAVRYIRKHSKPDKTQISHTPVENYQKEWLIEALSAGTNSSFQSTQNINNKQHEKYQILSEFYAKVLCQQELLQRSVKDSSNHQAVRDIERDTLCLNGRKLIGAEVKYEGILSAIKQAISDTESQVQLAALISQISQTDPLPHRSTMETEYIERLTTQILQIANRTYSGGDAYEAMMCVLGHRSDLCHIVPDNAMAPPINVDIDYGPIQLHKGIKQLGNEYAVGIRVCVSCTIAYKIISPECITTGTEDDDEDHDIASQSLLPFQLGFSSKQEGVSLFKHKRMMATYYRYMWAQFPGVGVATMDLGDDRLLHDCGDGPVVNLALQSPISTDTED